MNGGRVTPKWFVENDLFSRIGESAAACEKLARDTGDEKLINLAKWIRKKQKRILKESEEAEEWEQ